MTTKTPVTVGTTCTICETPLTPENTDKHPDTLGNLWCIPCVETPDIDWHALDQPLGCTDDESEV